MPSLSSSKVSTGDHLLVLVGRACSGESVTVYVTGDLDLSRRRSSDLCAARLVSVSTLAAAASSSASFRSRGAHLRHVGCVHVVRSPASQALRAGCERFTFEGTGVCIALGSGKNLSIDAVGSLGFGACSPVVLVSAVMRVSSESFGVEGASTAAAAEKPV